MPLTEIGWGRVRGVCEKCEHWVARTGDKWPHCEANGKESRVPLEYEFLNGPESNCPIGAWKDAVPMDVPATAEERRQEAIAAAATSAIALLKAFGGTVPDKTADIETELTALVSDNHLTAEVAAKIEEDLLAEKEALAK